MRELLERTKIISEKVKEVKDNPDIYYIGYWVDLAKQLNMSPQMLYKIRRRIMRKELNK